MLLVAVHRDHPVVAARVGPVERIDDALTVAAIFGMTDELNVGPSGEQIRGAVGAAVVDHQHLIVKLPDLLQHMLQIAKLVKNGYGDNDWQIGLLLAQVPGNKRQVQRICLSMLIVELGRRWVNRDLPEARRAFIIAPSPAIWADLMGSPGMLLRWLAVAGCAALALSDAACAPNGQADRDKPQAVETYVQGAQQYRAGDIEQAIATLERAVAVNPELRGAHILLGEAYRNKGNYEQAAIHYDAASKLDPYTLSNHYNLGVAYQFLNKLQDAAAAYLRALQLNPRDVKTNMNLGLVYLALGNIDQAVTYLERATRLDPQNANAWSNLGVALDARGSTVLAETTYRKALELDSNNVVTLQNLAQNLLSQGKAPEAITVMQEVLARQDSPPARKRYGDALARAKKYDDALAQYDKALATDGTYLAAINAKGFALIGRYVDGLELDDSQRAAAIELWRKSLSINPDQPRVTEAVKKWEKPGLFGN
jgi:tetratricopeptide (TPR) repeat protein